MGGGGGAAGGEFERNMRRVATLAERPCGTCTNFQALKPQTFQSSSSQALKPALGNGESLKLEFESSILNSNG